MSRRWIDVLASGDFGDPGTSQPRAASSDGTHDVWLIRHGDRAAVVLAASERLARQLGARALGCPTQSDLTADGVDGDGEPGVLLTGSVGKAVDAPSAPSRQHRSQR